MGLVAGVLWSSTAGAQAPAVTKGEGTPRSLGGRCGSANWVCVAQCIDVTCVDRCLAQGCEKALDTLAACAAKSGCGADDSDCVDKACGKQCDRTFEPAPPSPHTMKRAQTARRRVAPPAPPGDGRERHRRSRGETAR